MHVFITVARKTIRAVDDLHIVQHELCSIVYCLNLDHVCVQLIKCGNINKIHTIDTSMYYLLTYIGINKYSILCNQCVYILHRCMYESLVLFSLTCDYSTK